MGKYWLTIVFYAMLALTAHSGKYCSVWASGSVNIYIISPEVVGYVGTAGACPFWSTLYLLNRKRKDILVMGAAY